MLGFHRRCPWWIKARRRAWRTSTLILACIPFNHPSSALDVAIRGKAYVVDASLIVIAGKGIALAHIEAPAADQRCMLGKAAKPGAASKETPMD
ncbi:MAG: hypothetical protein ACR2PG_20750 [Hyphomicrobiaceae bacterium]